MATNKQRQIEFDKVMFSLVGNTNFQRFIEFLKDEREMVMLDASLDRVISDRRLLYTYMGSLRTYTDIIDRYNALCQSLEEQGEAERESAYG